MTLYYVKVLSNIEKQSLFADKGFVGMHMFWKKIIVLFLSKNIKLDPSGKIPFFLFHVVPLLKA